MNATPRIRGGIGADEEYWAALERGEFKLSRCVSCRVWMWPAHFRCGHCGSWVVAWEEVEPVGTIYTWTRNHALSEVIKERREDLPFVTVLVEIPQAGSSRVAGILLGDGASARIGAAVRGVIRGPEARAKGYATMAWQLVGDDR